MSTLHVPLHLPVTATRPMIERETRYSEVTSVKVQGQFLIIEHHRKPPEPVTGIWL